MTSTDQVSVLLNQHQSQAMIVLATGFTIPSAKTNIILLVIAKSCLIVLA